MSVQVTAMVGRKTLREATSTGNQLVAMGILTRAALTPAESEWKAHVAAGTTITLADFLCERGFITKDELQTFVVRQKKDRNIAPSNQAECEDALKVLRQTANAFKKATETHMQAVTEGMLPMADAK